MADRHSGPCGGAAWSIEQIPYHALAREQVRDDLQLFYVLASASFIEITSDLYARNLVEFLCDDGEVAAWLEQRWQSEELQHGVALKRYVQIAWPEFDWDGAYRSFFAEFRQFCAVDQLAATPALEMAARCVVETGTASFYRMLAASTSEPVLRQIASVIAADEVRHYKHFYRYFTRFQESEHLGRGAVLRTLWSRIREIDAEDALFAFKHVYLARNPRADFRKSDYGEFRDGLLRLARHHFPHDMALKMLLQPLDLSAGVKRVVVPTVTSAARLLFTRVTRVGGP